ncbi:MAG: hypothetical protein AB7E79_03635 [Rhodospirillaceae bacterium]
MSGLANYLKSRASGRAVTGAMIFAFLVVLVQHAVLIPHFQAATTFKPFDVQFPLTKYMIAIQLGAYEETAAAAYLPFVVVDLLLALVSTAALMLLWAWLFRAQPNRLFAFLERGAIFLLPVYTLACDIAENVAFARLIGGLAGANYAGTIDFAVMIHGVRGALLDLQVILTVVFVILYSLSVGARQPAGALRGEVAVDGD